MFLLKEGHHTSLSPAWAMCSGSPATLYHSIDFRYSVVSKPAHLVPPSFNSLARVKQRLRSLPGETGLCVAARCEASLILAVFQNATTALSSGNICMQASHGEKLEYLMV